MLNSHVPHSAVEVQFQEDFYSDSYWPKGEKLFDMISDKLGYQIVADSR